MPLSHQFQKDARVNVEGEGPGVVFATKSFGADDSIVIRLDSGRDIALFGTDLSKVTAA